NRTMGKSACAGAMLVSPRHSRPGKPSVKHLHHGRRGACMDLFLDIALSFPTVVLSLLLAVLLGYWALAVLGLFDLDAFETSLLPDGDALEVGGISGLLMKLGLDGVPLTLIFTVIVLLAWLGCYFIDYALLRA